MHRSLVVFASLFVRTRERLGAFGSTPMTILLALVVKHNAVRDVDAAGPVITRIIV